MRRPLLKVFVFTTALAIAIGFVEVVCRIAGVDFNPDPTRRFHASWGWTQERSRQFQMHVDGHDVRVQFNAMGFRDVEHQVEKPAGTKRLLVLGDSFSEAIQVNLQETFWHRLGAMLNGNRPGPWEIINLGVGDWGTAQAYRVLLDHGLQYQPDVVLLQFFPFNDVCNNSIELAGMCQSDSDSYRPYYVPAERGLELAWSHPARRWLRTNLVTFGVLERLLSMVPAGSRASEGAERTTREGLPAKPTFETFVEGAEQHPVMTRAWQTTESLLRLIDEACRSRGIKWFPVVVPLEYQIRSKWPDIQAIVPGVTMNREYPERRVAGFAAGLGTTSVPLLAAFDANESQVIPYRDGHFNPAGHQLAAEVIYDAMIETGLAAASATPAATPSHLRFGLPETRAWMRNGWGNDDGGGDGTFVWSLGPRSGLDLPLPLGVDVRMDMLFKPFEYPGSPTQTVTVALNGAVIQTVSLTSGLRTYSVVLPRAGIRRTTNTLEFIYGYAARPDRTGMNAADTRELAVAWHAIEFAPVKAPRP